MTTIKREDLLARLGLVEPALAEHNLLPILTHFWWTGKKVMAFNDQIGISVPFKSEFSGAVPGDVLLSLLKASEAEEALLVQHEDGKNLVVKAGSTKMNLPIMGPDNFVFDMPRPTSEETLVPLADAEPFLQAVKGCMRSVSADTSTPDQLGITVIPEGDTMSLFATNNSTLSHAKLPLKNKNLKDRVILSSQFCEQMLRLADPKKPLRLEIHDDYSLLVAGTTNLFGRLIDSSHPINFTDVLAQHMPTGVRKSLVKIPEQLKLILQRAIIITESNIDKTTTQLTVKDGMMKFFSKSLRGEITDTMRVESQHPDVALKIEPKLVSLGCGDFDQMVATKDCFIMTKAKNSIYLVSANE